MSEIQTLRDQRASLNREVARLTVDFRDSQNTLHKVMASNKDLHEQVAFLESRMARDESSQ